MATERPSALGRDARARDVELLALRHGVGVLRRQVGRTAWHPGDRFVLAALSRRLPRAAWGVLPVRPETLPPGTRPYDCRHAYATELLAEGVPLHEVSWLMGHASVHFTADVYGHRVKPRDEAARSALERALGDA